jgi:hypothetical protein
MHRETTIGWWFSAVELRGIEKLVVENEKVLAEAWNEYFSE